MRILMIEDVVLDATLLNTLSKTAGFDFIFNASITRRIPQGTIGFGRPSFSQIMDCRPSMGSVALSLAPARAPEVPFIFVTGSLGEEMTIKALKSGRPIYLKHRLTTLPAAIHRALRQLNLGSTPKSEQALHSSEERYRSLVELSPDALLSKLTSRVVFHQLGGCNCWGLPSGGSDSSPDQGLHPSRRLERAARAAGSD
jgi:hypothetical protein